MKISKVNHMKAGVSEKPITAGGMLYSFPGKEGKTDLAKHIEKLNNKAKGLYNVFTPSTEKKYKEAFTEIRSCFSGMIINPLKDQKSDEIIVDKLVQRNGKEIHIYNEKTHKNEMIKDPDYVATYIVNANLRQSLRRTVKSGEKSVYIPDVIKQICVAVLSGEHCKEKMSQIDKNDLLLAICGIRKDYTKEEQMKKIAKSIAHQNVPVQIAEDGEHIILSSAYNEKKNYIFDFLKKYTEENKDQQAEMLRHMRYLILLFYFGEKIATEAEDLSAWSFGLSVTDKCDYDGPLSDNLLDLILSKENTPVSNKATIRGFQDQIVMEVKHIVVERYQAALKAPELSDIDKKWISYISDRAAKLLSTKKLTQEKIRKSYLCKKTWEEWVSLIAKKYIEIGKGAYYFALSDVDRVPSGDQVCLGTVSEEYREGLSSFDYERIKAEDALNRELSRYVSFAVSHFDSSIRSEAERSRVDVIEKKTKKGIEERKKTYEDILVLRKDDIHPYDDAKKRVLRYFGGASSFTGTEVENSDDMAFILAIRDELYAARNCCFHFVTGESKIEDKSVIEAIFEKEYASAGEVYRKRFFSNNVPMFYGVNDIDRFMDHLYSDRKMTVAQVPSFNKILPRKGNKYVEFISRFLKTENKNKVADPTVAEIYRSSFYFLLKEIYYYDFLGEENLVKRFEKALETAHEREIKRVKSSEQQERSKAYDDFTKRADMLLDSRMDFGEFCQEIMTEYNQQNHQKEKKPSGVKVTTKDKNGNETTKIVSVEDKSHIYQHYRMLLYMGLCEAFFDYISEEKNASRYGFLRKPENRSEQFEKMKEDEFCQGWQTKTFDHIKSNVMQDTGISSWYVTAHFLDPKNLNHLIGTLKNFMQFVTDIERRAKATGNKSYDTYKQRVQKYTKLIEVLEFVKMYCGQVSNKIEDYFRDKEEYAKYISNFMEYGNPGVAELQAFCNEVEGANYYDGLNPIPNRNIVLSTLYGNETILSHTMKKITEKELKEYSKLKRKLADVFESGTCTKEEDQRKLRRFQNMKNRIELVDVLIMTELLNDLYGQLVSYSYLRERDLMFMQLGYYYVKLFFTDSVPADDKLRKLQGDCNITDGAVLYQIVAMYSYDLPIYDQDAKKTKAERMQIGSKIPYFVKKYGDEQWDIYTNGLCFFEDVDKRHDEYVTLRNYIDHFKYFADQKKSILDLYGEMYNGFFSYDTKLKKSISFILPNILLSYFVNARLEFQKGEMQKTNGASYVKATLSLKELKSDCFTYKTREAMKIEKKEEKQVTVDFSNLADCMMGGGIKEKEKTEKSNKKTQSDNEAGKEYKLEARASWFLDEVENILSYRKNEE